MKRMWMVYVISGLVAVGAGVAIAGVPSNRSTGGAIAELPAIPATTTTTVAPTTVPSTTVAPTTTLPEPTTTVAAETTTPVTEPTGTDPAEEAPPDAPEATVDRADLAVEVANGANVIGFASRTAASLESLGYVGVGAVNTATVATSTVYFAPGFEGEAIRLAADAGLPASAIAPITDAPTIEPARLLALLLVLGSDRL
jgi:cytoskeletal protein RodZ